MNRLFTSIFWVMAVGSLRAEFRFIPVTEKAGIDVRHRDGRTGQRYFIETIGSGAAWLDYDNDGDLDLYLVNAGDAPFAENRVPEHGKNRLYRNRGDGTFEDVTDKGGVGDTGYGVSATAADYDNDGWIDLFVTNYGKTLLYRNRGDGTFEDVTEKAGVADSRWSTAAAFGDVDNDGDLDLYVVFYCVWDLSRHKICHEQEVPIYCGPEYFEGDSDRLFRNNGDGTFSDMTREAGIHDVNGKGLGVLLADLDDDGDLDIYVANDGTPNFLFRNDGSGKFEEIGWMAGVDTDENGNPQGSMGIALGDINRDGRGDLVVTNFQRQYNTVYRNDGEGFFSDISFVAGMGSSLPNVSWGTHLGDFDSDGFLDLFIANGHIQDNVEQYDKTTSSAQRNRLLRNTGDGRFVDVTDSSGEGLQIVKMSRGAAFADYDNDGDLDVLVQNANDFPDLLRNDTPQGHFVRVLLEGRQSNRNGIGARVTLFTPDGKKQVAQVSSGNSYASQNEYTLHFGLGDLPAAERLEVRWPSGIVDVVENPPVDRPFRVVEGTNTVAAETFRR